MLRVDERASIGIFGHFGNRNLGDEAIITAVIQNIRRRLPDCEIIGFSLKPDDTAERHHIDAYAIRHLPRARSQPSPAGHHQNNGSSEFGPNDERTNLSLGQRWVNQTKKFIKGNFIGRKMIFWTRAFIGAGPAIVRESLFLRSSYKILKNVDLLLIVGSNQLMDSFGGCNEGAWGFPYTLLKWTILSKLCGTEVVYLSVGAGPITSTISKKMIRYALKLSNYISLRDTRSQRLIENLGAKGPTAVFPDLAFSLCRDQKSTASTPPRQRVGKPTVGINPMPVYDSRYWYIHDAGRYGSYVKKLAMFSAALLREGYPLSFWATQPKDENVIADVLACLESELGMDVDANAMISSASSVSALLDVIDSFDITIATRFHGIVLSLLSGKAVMSICYHKKMDDLMKEMEQSDYSVMLDSLEVTDLLNRFKQLERKRDQEVAKVKGKTAEYRESLARQYDVLLAAPDQVQGN